MTELKTNLLSMIIKALDTTDSSFQKKLTALLTWDSAADKTIRQTVRAIVKTVREQGDQALVDYSNQFDQVNVKHIEELAIPKETARQALNSISVEQRTALEQAAARIRSYHERQLQASWYYTETDGTVLGQKITALDRVGIYVPGGKASYPSSVLMNAIPAKVAGVQDIIMVVPTPHNELNPLVLAAAAIAEVNQIWRLGGAQAIAALAYGTASITKVDKIVGPGNIYVATAKKMVFGRVGIDMIAGPSEISIVTDGSVDPDWLAMDLCAQAEHDETAQSILLCPDADFLKKVKQSLEKLLPQRQRQAIIKTALTNRGALIKVKDLDEAITITNQIAPEHLQLAVAEPEALLPKIHHAGAIFMGANTAEVMGDYCAGPNHVLPTLGSARFSSPLGVYDFQKRSSVIYCTAESAQALAKTASVIAAAEGLEAHAQSALYRTKTVD